MADQENLRVLFTQKAESVISDILKNNGLDESEEEFFSKLEQGEDSKTIIVRNATETIVKKIIPEKKLIELLQKHLKVSTDTAEKIVQEVKSRLLPLLLIYPDEKFDDPVFREEVSKKIFGPEEKEAPPPFIKKIEIKNVEENAKIIQRDKKFTRQDENVKPEGNSPTNTEQVKKIDNDKIITEKKSSDSYREPIE